MADKRASLFTLVTSAYGSNYVPILVQLSPGTFANCRITVDAFVNTVIPPDDLALQAYNIAITGTNAAASAQSTASTALSTANSAYSIAVIGTNAAASGQSTGSSALSVANSAYSIAVIGTNAAASALSTANSAYSIAVIGTNAAASAQSTANTALSTANTANTTANTAFSTAVVADGLALEAYHLAQIGTNTGTAAYNLASAALPQTGGTISGDLTVTGRLIAEQWIDVPSVLVYSGTTVIDFSGPSSLTLGVSADTQFATANLSGTNYGKMIKVALTATGAGTAALNLTYPAWKVIGGALASNITNGKSAILSLELYGTTDASVWSVMASES